MEPERIELLSASLDAVIDRRVHRALPLRNAEGMRTHFSALPTEPIEAVFRQFRLHGTVGYLVTRDPAGGLRFVAVEPSGPVMESPQCPLSGDEPVAALFDRLQSAGGPVRCCVAGFDVTLRLVAIPVAAHHR